MSGRRGLMIDLSKYTPAIQVKLESGVYVFSDSAASGKSYLCSALHGLRTVERVDGHAYPSDFYPAELLDRSKRDLVMLDRYDMYCGQGVEEIAKFAQTGGIVLIDCKSYQFPMIVTTCFLRFREGELVIW